MLTRTTRILTTRRLRPPSQSLRLFTQNRPQLLLAYAPRPRPQLPYLTQPAFKHQNGPSQQLARLLTTETRTYVKEQTLLAVKWTVIPCTLLFLGAIIYFGVTVELEERRNPTPAEWSLATRHALRGARLFARPKELETAGFIDWAKVSSKLRRALVRLEDPNTDGKGLSEPAGEGEEIVIPGVGRAGFDIAAKSWPWRAGYFEVIMGCATAAEHLDGMVLDMKNHLVFQKEFVVGPSNPDPRPTPSYMKVTPKEEDVAPASPPPETYYMRILTGKGFTTKQKMEAARAYANWLDFKKLPESAEEMYRWNLDIAKSALDISVNPDDIIDSKTGIVKDGNLSREVTPNLLRASTDLAVHFASNGNVAAALPILLSVLRARRTAPISPFPQPETSYSESSSGLGIMSLFSAPKFPSPPASGDNPLIRTSDRPTCEESALMLYIGEIIFASKPSKEGLGWTRQAVTIADASLAQPAPTTEVDEAEEKKKCKECLMMGVRNWETMLSRLASGQKETGSKGWVGWGGSNGDDQGEIANDRVRLDVLKERIAREKIGLQTMQVGPMAPVGGWSR